MWFAAMIGCSALPEPTDRTLGLRTIDATDDATAPTFAGMTLRDDGWADSVHALPSARGSRTSESSAAIRYENTVWAVSNCEALHSTLDQLQTVRFGPDAVMTLAIAPGVFTCTQPITIDHPQGEQIAILGDLSDPAAVTLRFDGDGIVVRGHSLGRIDGLTLLAATPGTGVGISAVRNGDITVGPHVHIADFAVGERAAANGSILNEGDERSHLVVERTEVGLRAVSGGLIEASWPEIREASFVGLHATSGGILIADHARIQTDDLPVVAQRGGMILADGSDSITSASVGVSAERGGYISWENGSSRSAEWDYHADLGSTVDVSGSTGRMALTAPPTVYR